MKKTQFDFDREWQKAHEESLPCLYLTLGYFFIGVVGWVILSYFN